ncbi:Ulp1 protease family, carboxy-terminal domain protein [Arachis hypogaea]|nr:Ulp1 protease family, carboxy-terminal domain protein [Arachis hypogaea]
MDLAGVELTVAAYIFSKDLPNSEILAYVEHCIADRTALLTLAPNERVMDDVITVVATMLSKTSNSYQWFMPTMIMQDALQGTHLTHANLDAVICNHMRCKVNKVTEIFQPMWTDGYWYLMVVDVRRKKLIYYDSLKCTRETEHRKFAMTQVALHLESLTVGTNWLSSCTAERPRFSSYEYEEPVVLQQHRRSMDCGIWVLQWIIRGVLWAIHSVTVVMILVDLQAVNDQIRIQIAIDLVLRSHNPSAIDILEKAMRY